VSVTDASSGVGRIIPYPGRGPGAPVGRLIARSNPGTGDGSGGFHRVQLSLPELVGFAYRLLYVTAQYTSNGQSIVKFDPQVLAPAGTMLLAASFPAVHANLAPANTLWGPPIIFVNDNEQAPPLAIGDFPNTNTATLTVWTELDLYDPQDLRQLGVQPVPSVFT
jgi:hypothetical protein